MNRKQFILLMADAPAGGGDKETKATAEAKPKTIYVKAREPIHEGAFYAKGEIFEVEAKRAKSLGKLVVEVKAKEVDGKLVEIAD